MLATLPDPDFIDWGSSVESNIQSSDRVSLRTKESGYIDTFHPSTNSTTIDYTLRIGLNGSYSSIVLKYPNNVICPQGSTKPLRVLPGYYSTGNNMTTRTIQIPCAVGTYCKDGVSKIAIKCFFKALFIFHAWIYDATDRLRLPCWSLRQNRAPYFIELYWALPKRTLLSICLYCNESGI